jgi:hypothetical protein
MIAFEIDTHHPTVFPHREKIKVRRAGPPDRGDRLAPRDADRARTDGEPLLPPVGGNRFVLMLTVTFLPFAFFWVVGRLGRFSQTALMT